VRAWGRQLYALVGMFYLPVFVDALWLRGGGDVQWVERATDASRRKEVWELLTTLVYAGNSNQSNCFTCGLPRSIPIDVLRPGDTIKVGFGPFEYWCLFRN
jgi:hypothetical protein